MSTKKPNRYARILERAFFARYEPDARVVELERRQFESVAEELGVRLPKNLGDLIYSFRYRYPLPESILALLDEGEEWVIRPGGRGIYRFEKARVARIVPRDNYAEIRVPDATPGIINLYALGDEQALLAKIRYNRLIDIFLRITCYPLQSHLRTTVKGDGTGGNGRDLHRPGPARSSLRSTGAGEGWYGCPERRTD